MRVIQVAALEGPQAVVEAEVDDPVPGPDQVLIEVHAAGVTFPEVLQTRGRYQIKLPLPFVPGCEVAGTVRSAPPASGFAPGDRVAALTQFGAYAELAVAPVDQVFPLPDSMEFAIGAAVPINYLTAQFAMVRRGRLRTGETVLVHGAAGGVGSAAVQLARALGATVVAVASSPEKAELARAAGAHHVVAADGFLAAVKDSVGAVDVVVDPVGGDRFTDSLRSLRPEGRLLVIGFAGGEIPTVRVNRLLLNNIEVVGVAWGEYASRRPGSVAEQWREIEPLVASGALAPPVGHRLPLAAAGEALALLDDRRAVGRVVLDVR